MTCLDDFVVFQRPRLGVEVPRANTTHNPISRGMFLVTSKALFWFSQNYSEHPRYKLMGSIILTVASTL